MLLGLSLAASLASQGPVTPTLLVDLDTRPPLGPNGSTPLVVDSHNGTVWFLATTAEEGRELFETDGTAGGTFRFDPIRPGEDSSVAFAHRMPTGRLLLHGNSPAFGQELFTVAPGSRTPQLLQDLEPGPGGSRISRFASLGAEGWFTVSRAANTELWRTTGVLGSTLLEETLVGVESATPVTIHGKLWIHEYPPAAGRLWIKDQVGSPSRELLQSLGGFRVRAVFGALGSRVLLAATDGLTGLEPWISDGTDAGTVRLGDLAAGAAGSDPRLVALDDANGRAWFTASTPTTGQELWITDGTAAGTRMVADLGPGSADGSFASGHAAFGGLLFASGPSLDQSSLWFSDGTAGGTRPVVAPGQGVVPLWPSHFVEAAGKVWFQAGTAANGRELWSTDGTRVGTSMVVDLKAGSDDSHAEPLAVTANGVLVRADDGATGQEPWILEPATANLRLLDNLAADPLTGGNGVDFFLEHDDFALFSGRPNGGRIEPMVTDGTAAGTVPLGLGDPNADVLANPLARLPAGVLFFIGSYGNPTDLWITDGSVSGTRSIATFPGGIEWFGPDDNVAVTDDGAAWFRVHDNGRLSVWKSDGTSNGTRQVQALVAHPDFRPEQAIGSRVVGSNRDAIFGDELWVTDGTAAGTRMLADLEPGPADSFLRRFAQFRGGVLIEQQGFSVAGALIFTDGTAANTRPLGVPPAVPSNLLANFVVFGERLLFPVGSDLLVSDGTAAGTSVLWSGAARSPVLVAGSPVVSGDRAFFMPSFGPMDLLSTELWVTDGTTAGTSRLLALPPNRATAHSGGLMQSLSTGTNGRAVLSRWTPQIGNELWTSDGTVAGTRPLADSAPGPLSSRPMLLGRIEDRYVFLADDGVHGRELHAVAFADAAIGLAAPIGRGCGASVRMVDEPRIGRSATLSIHSAASRPAGLVIGLAPSFRNPSPTCEINVAAPIGIGAFSTDPSGRTDLPLVIPNDPALQGATFLLQSAIATPGGALFGTVELTEGLLVVVGG